MTKVDVFWSTFWTNFRFRLDNSCLPPSYHFPIACACVCLLFNAANRAQSPTFCPNRVSPALIGKRRKKKHAFEVRPPSFYSACLILLPTISCQPFEFRRKNSITQMQSPAIRINLTHLLVLIGQKPIAAHTKRVQKRKKFSDFWRRKTLIIFIEIN